MLYFLTYTLTRTLQV